MGRHRHSGFSIIEILISITVVAILVAVGIPSYKNWIQNTQIRTAGESLVNGLQTARNEAIRRNSCVQAKLVSVPKTAWDVRVCASAEDPAVLPLSERAHEEGSVNASVEPTPAEANIVSFNALGRIMDPNPSDGSPPLRRIEVRNTGMDVVDERKLRIEIPPGGAVRMCDPNTAIATSDPRHC